MFDDDKTIDEILDTYWDQIKKGDYLITTIQSQAKQAIWRVYHSRLPVSLADEEIRNQISVTATLTHNPTGYTAEDLVAQALRVHNKLLAAGVGMDNMLEAADELVKGIAIGEIKLEALRKAGFR